MSASGLTMPHPLHPDDELLAALAGDEPEAVTDAALGSHVAACDRCGPMVEDLRQLRSTLAQLPDVAPSRPLQLLPPVPEPAFAFVSTGAVGMGAILRRLTAPAMTLAAVLILVGAIGTAVGGGGAGLGGAALASGEAAQAAPGQPVASARASRDAKESSAGPSAARTPAGASVSAGVPIPGGASASAGASEPLFNAYRGAASNAAGDQNISTTNPGSPRGNPFPFVLGTGVALLAAAFLARGFANRLEGGSGV